jgi:hypothetical protein
LSTKPTSNIQWTATYDLSLYPKATF